MIIGESNFNQLLACAWIVYVLWLVCRRHWRERPPVVRGTDGRWWAERGRGRGAA